MWHILGDLFKIWEAFVFVCAQFLVLLRTGLLIICHHIIDIISATQIHHDQWMLLSNAHENLRLKAFYHQLLNFNDPCKNFDHSDWHIYQSFKSNWNELYFKTLFLIWYWSDCQVTNPLPHLTLHYFCCLPIETSPYREQMAIFFNTVYLMRKVWFKLIIQCPRFAC